MERTLWSLDRRGRILPLTDVLITCCAMVTATRSWHKRFNPPHCFDAKTGEARWEERLGGRFRASLLYAEGRIYATNDKGKTIVFRAVPKGFEKISANDLNEFCYATPAISHGSIYVRTGKHLYRIENRAHPQ